jgi:hypothetical protein
MNIATGDRFYSDKHKSHGTVVQYKNFENWTFTLDSEPGKIRRARYSPNKVRWVKVVSIDGKV